MAEHPSEHPDSTPAPPSQPAQRHRLNEDVQYEATQVPLGKVILVLIAIAAAFVLAGFVSRTFVHIAAKPVPETTFDRGSYSKPPGELPAEPRLEYLGFDSDPTPEDVFARQLEMERILRGYGKSDEEGFVRIPIEEAMRVAAEKIPSRKVLSDDLVHSFGLVGGGESSAGRDFQEVPPWLEPAK